MMRSYLLKADDGLFDRIDAVCGKGGRAGWIRGAIEAALSEKKSDGFPLEDRIERATEALDAKYPKKAVSDDREVLLALVQKKALSERQAMEALGWMELRVSKVAGKLATASLIRYRDGLMEAV